MGLSLGFGLGLTHRRAVGVPDPAHTLFTGFHSGPDIAYARANGFLWQDAAKTTPAVAADDPVRVVVCPWSAVEFTAPADASRALLKNPSGDLWYLEFDGSNDYYVFSGPDSKPLTVHLAFRLSNVVNSFAGLSAAAGGQKWKISDDGNGDKQQGGKEGVYNWAAGTGANLANTDYVLGMSYGTTGAAVYWRDGATDGTGDADVSNDTFTAGLSRVGANSAGTELISGRVYGWAVYAAGLTDAQNEAVQDYLAALQGRTL